MVDDVRRLLERNVGDATPAQHHSLSQLLLLSFKHQHRRRNQNNPADPHVNSSKNPIRVYQFLHLLPAVLFAQGVQPVRAVHVILADEELSILGVLPVRIQEGLRSSSSERD